MRKGLANPNSVQALKEMKMEIANELGISDIESAVNDKDHDGNREINKRVVERYRNNLIGFK